MFIQKNNECFCVCTEIISINNAFDLFGLFELLLSKMYAKVNLNRQQYIYLTIHLKIVLTYPQYTC